MEHDALYKKLEKFAHKENAALSEVVCVKSEQQLQGQLEANSKYGIQTYFVATFSRKTLPETLVWYALLEARSAGLPLMVLKDSEFPKTLGEEIF